MNTTPSDAQLAAFLEGLTPAEQQRFWRGFSEYARQKTQQTEAARWRTPQGIVDFVTDKLHANPTDYQADILRALVEKRRVAVRGPHGLGKTAISSWVILWSLYAFDEDTKCLVTASVWRQVERYTFPEVKKWLYGASLDPRPYTLQTALRLPNKEAFGASADNPYNLEGLHATNAVVIMDESKAIPDTFFDALEGALSSGNTYALMLSTPGPTAGRFYEVHSRRAGFSDWTAIHVTIAQAIAAGRVDPQWVENRRAQWGENSAVFKTRVLGEFDESGEDSVIPLHWVERSIERWHTVQGKGEGATAWGCDPARFGTDKTAIVRRVGDVFEALDYYSKEDTMQVTGRLTSQAAKTDPVLVDVIGIGSGIADRLKELNYKVIPVNVAASTTITDASGEIGFVNLRSALWWSLRRALDPSSERPIALPPDDRLIGDLTAPKWTYTSAGKIKVESKDETRARIGRSTDAADAVMLALYADLPGAKVKQRPVPVIMEIRGLYRSQRDGYRRSDKKKRVDPRWQ